MKGRDFLALTLGFNLLGGVLAGLLLGYAFDRWLMEGLLGVKSFPFGLLFFFVVGIFSGLLNAYRDLKKIQ
ncbi:MAG: AtpZ/AtpI family protein [Aquificaceae bacterium]|nr:AtpZ/AtpI family protein [Aquificaceae bacterium]MDW8097072.1 AtpZ/AtpI family protein [Aquificaceae bacterium]